MNESKTKTKSILKLHGYYEDFIISVLVLLIFPLLSVIIEWSLSSFQSVDLRTLTLATSMYSVSVGFSSQRKLTMTMGMVISFVFAVLYGLAYSDPHILTSNEHLDKLSAICIILIFLIHLTERFNRHVIGGEPFMKFE